MPKNNWFGTSWSLTFEEWTYVLLPALSFYALRGRAHSVLTAACFISVIALALRIALIDPATNWDTCVRKIMIMRLDAIAYGIIFACAYSHTHDHLTKWSRQIAIVGFILLVGNLVIVSDPDQRGGFYCRVLLFPILGISICAVMPMVMMLRCRGLGSKIVTFLSKISYSLYLTHWSVMFLMGGVPLHLRFLVYIAASIAVATLLTYLIEQPIMRRRPRQYTEEDDWRSPSPTDIRVVKAAV